MKKLLCCIAALSLSACSTFPSVPPQSPAPLATTTIDDSSLSAAWKVFDVALDAIDLWKAAKPSVKGTSKAIAIANGVDHVTAFLTAAELAAAAGSVTDYKVALANAKAALDTLRADMKKGE